MYAVFSNEPIRIESGALFTFAAGTQLAVVIEWPVALNVGVEREWYSHIGVIDDNGDILAYIPWMGGYALELTSDLVGADSLMLWFDGPPGPVVLRGTERILRLRVA
jgi:hypothetical protein